MSEKQHTPGEMTIWQHGTSDAPACVLAIGSELVAMTLGGNDEANAAFIVTACNSHDALVSVLRRYVEVDSGIEEDDLLRTARAALAAAGVKE